MTSHGRARYDAGCRCGECRAANTAKVQRNRARRAADPSRLTHGSRSAYDAGCRCPDCLLTRAEAYWRLEDGPRRHWWRELVTQTYRDARDAWEANKERGEGMQLEWSDYRKLYPAPTLRAVLEGLASSKCMM